MILVAELHLHLEDHDFIFGRFPHVPAVLFVELFAGVHFQRVPILSSEHLAKLLSAKDKKEFLLFFFGATFSINIRIGLTYDLTTCPRSYLSVTSAGLL